MAFFKRESSKHQQSDESAKKLQKQKKLRSRSTRGSNTAFDSVAKMYGEKQLKLSVYNQVLAQTTPLGRKFRSQLALCFIVCGLALGLGLGIGIRPPHHPPISPYHPLPTPKQIATDAVNLFAHNKNKEQKDNLRLNKIDNLWVYKSPNYSLQSYVNQGQQPFVYLPLHNIIFLNGSNGSQVQKNNPADNTQFWTVLSANDFSGNTYDYPVTIKIDSKNKSVVQFSTKKMGSNQKNEQIAVQNNTLDVDMQWSVGERVSSNINFQNLFDNASGEYSSYLNCYPDFKNSKGELDKFASGPMTDYKFSSNFVSTHSSSQFGSSDQESSITFQNQEFNYSKFNFSGIQLRDFKKSFYKGSLVSVITAKQMFDTEKFYNQRSRLTEHYHYHDSTGVDNSSPGQNDSFKIVNYLCPNDQQTPLYTEKNWDHLFYYNMLNHQPNQSLVSSLLAESAPKTSINKLTIPHSEKQNIAPSFQFQSKSLTPQYDALVPNDYYSPNNKDQYISNAFRRTKEDSPGNNYLHYQNSAVLAPFVLKFHYVWIPDQQHINYQWNQPNTKWALAIVYNFDQTDHQYQVAANFTSTFDPNDVCSLVHDSTWLNNITSTMSGYNKINYRDQRANPTTLDHWQYENLHFPQVGDKNDLDVNRNGTMELNKVVNSVGSTDIHQLMYWVMSA